MKKSGFSFGMIPTATIILFIVAIMLAVWGGYQSKVADSADFIDNAVFVQGGASNSENDGKYVCVPGKLTVNKAPSDPLTGISANGIALVRDVEMYQYFIKDDMVYKHFSSAQEKNIVGDKGERFNNPVFPADYSQSVFLAETAINGGELIVGSQYINELTLYNNMTQKTFERVDVNLSDYADKLPGFKLVDGYFCNGDLDNPKIGDLRIKYTYIPAENVGEVTLFGIQKNSIVGGVDEGKSYIVASATDVAGLKESLYKSHEDTASGLTGAAFICAVVGVIILAVRIKKIKKEEGSEV